MVIRKIDFAIIILIMVGIVLLLDNLILSGITFQFPDVHHETFIIACFVSAFALYLVRRRLL